MAIAEPMSAGSQIQLNTRTRAAQYVRMSTEHQRYSTRNQARAIQRYATQRYIDIVQTYADEGRSGLTAHNRPGLQQLLADVQRNQGLFDVILVYDVSRWGRFQDADESAYYEYICRRSGIPVHYCAEQFENDGSPISTIVKGVKRAMAGEYSRELSTKVFAGHCQLVERGYWQGGAPAFGLRRQLISQAGDVKAQLQRGERKSLQTDRVVVVAGPAEEVEVVTGIFKAFVLEQKEETEIARQLNVRGFKTVRGRPWSRASVRGILSNETYIGNYVWNRASAKLKRKRIRNPLTLFIRKDAAFSPIIDRSLFDAAQARFQARRQHRPASDEEMIDCLRRLLAQRGYLSKPLVDQADDAPSSTALQQRFGSLTEAFSRAGYVPPRDCRYIEINRRARAIHIDLITVITAGIQRVGGTVAIGRHPSHLIVNDQFAVAVVVARCWGPPVGLARWHANLEPTVDITLIARMDQENNKVLDFYVLPSLEAIRPRVRLLERNDISLDCYRFADLESLFQLAACEPIRESEQCTP